MKKRNLKEVEVDGALYVYGIIKFNKSESNLKNLEWREKDIGGVDGKKVYIINIGGFNVLVHDCEEKPFFSEEPNKIREMLIAHNRILDMAMEEFNGVIPLQFNTIIKKGKTSSKDNLKKWITSEKKTLERIWDKTKGKKEYGIKIYYNNKLIQEISNDKKIDENEKSQQCDGEGLSYLLREKSKIKIDEMVQNKINQFKQEFYHDINEITDDIKVNISTISLNENEKEELLCSLSVLIDTQEINKIKETLEKRKDMGFSFQFAGPFAPYSFVGDEIK